MEISDEKFDKPAMNSISRGTVTSNSTSDKCCSSSIKSSSTLTKTLDKHDHAINTKTTAMELTRRFSLAFIAIFLASGYGIIYLSTSWRIFHLRRSSNVYHIGLSKYCEYSYKDKLCQKGEIKMKGCDLILIQCSEIENPTVAWQTRGANPKSELVWVPEAKEKSRHSEQVVDWALKLPKTCIPSACILTLLER